MSNIQDAISRIIDEAETFRAAAERETDLDRKAKLVGLMERCDKIVEDLTAMVSQPAEAELQDIKKEADALTGATTRPEDGDEAAASPPDGGADDAEAEDAVPSEDARIVGDPSDDGVAAPDPGAGATIEGLRLSEAHLIALWRRSLFPIRVGRIVVFGIRGCLPVDRTGTQFAPAHSITGSVVNFRTMNCTLGQWRPSEGFALFPGSTVPFADAVAEGVTRGGTGVNQMGRGRYLRYMPGFHKRSDGPAGHWALRQECPITLQRTADDTDFDTGDKWEAGRIAGDNIHCAFHMGPAGQIPNARYSSVGCQVVAGTVKKGEKGSERGPWARFIEPFLPGPGMQEEAEYVLFDMSEVEQVLRNRLQDKTVILRVGSSGEPVKQLQRQLSVRLGRRIEDDGDFGTTTFQAVLEFQNSVFGPNADDGIVGPETAAELGMTLPEFDFADAIAGGNGRVDGASGASIAPRASQKLSASSSTAASGRSAAGTEPSSGDEPIAWGAAAERKAGPGFKAKVVQIARRLRCDPSHLMAVMAFESGETFAPDKRNAAGSKAVGLIQFMPTTARDLGTTSDALAAMTAVAQLDFVELYLRRVARGRPMPTLSDLYMAVLLPSAVGRPEAHVLFQQGTVAFRQNRGLDTNGDGVVTKAEATSKVAERLLRGMKTENIG